MSTWTHIAATIVVETFATEKNIKGYIKRKLKNSPKITGSEGNADIFVNELSGYNFYTSADCKRCKYGKTWKYDYDGSIICDADKDFICPSGDYQTCVCITIVGDLRDKTKAETLKEYASFLQYITNTLKFIILMRCEYIEEHCLWEEKGLFIPSNGKIIYKENTKENIYNTLKEEKDERV